MKRNPCFEYLDGEDHCPCGNSLDDGEGWDGKCGNCADKAQTPYRWKIKIRYVDPDVSGSDPEQLVGDVARVSFLFCGEEIDSLDFREGQEIVEEIEYWLFNENPED